MSRVRRIRYKTDHSVYYNVDTVKRNAKMIQNGEGTFDVAKQVASKVASKLTGNFSKDIAIKAATKAFEKGAEHAIHIVLSRAS